MKKEKQKQAVAVVPSKTCVKLRIEKKSRGGKSVTVLYDLPENPDYFKKLLKQLKAKCACGGSLKLNPLTIEIQGDQRQKIKDELLKMGFQVKGA